LPLAAPMSDQPTTWTLAHVEASIAELPLEQLLTRQRAER
jgi:hypothetical protein